MSEDTVVPFDANVFRLPSCRLLHGQLRPGLNEFTADTYVQYLQERPKLYLCGIVRKAASESRVLAIAAYRSFLTTFDTVRFELDDLVVDENERNHGLGTHLFHYLVDQAKQRGASSMLVHCDLTQADAHRFFFRLGLTIIVYEFYVDQLQVLASNDRIEIIDITDLPEKENERLLLQAQDVHRQLRPHLPEDPQAYIRQVREICRTGPARLVIAINWDERKDVLGLAVYRVTNNTRYSQHIYCDDLVSDENKRSSGVGRCLINVMKDEGRKLGIHGFILDSGCQRGRAHKFYYREGFRIDRFGFSIKF